MSLKTARDTMERRAQAPTLAPTFPLLLGQALTQKLAIVRCPWSLPSTPRWSTQRPKRTSHRRCTHRTNVVVPRQDGRQPPPPSASPPPPSPLGLSCVRVGSWLFGSFSSLCVRACPPFVNNITNGCLAIHAKHATCVLPIRELFHTITFYTQKNTLVPTATSPSDWDFACPSCLG